MNDKALLNYPGSKKRLLDFIFNNSKQYIKEDKYILDIFSGTGCVAQMFKSKGYKVFANDVEIYASNISSVLLKNNHKINFDSLEKNYEYNKNQLLNIYGSQIEKEDELIKSSSKDLISFNESLLKVWESNFKIVINNNIITSIDELNKHKYDIPFMLFTLYYSGVYFGLKQSIEIDSIRYAIEKEQEKDVLLTALYYAIKEVSFSKDGHMAQPLNQNKNFKKLIDVRSKNIYEIFKLKLQEFSEINDNTFEGKSFNLPFDKLINLEEIKNNVGFIYADPPYTDMQYSRYFHLLTTISNYEYPYMTYKQGKITTGLYAENRFQSNISSKSKSLTELKKLMSFSSENKINLCFSYAYPVDLEKQASDRYTMNINDLISEMNTYFDNVVVVKENYSHCNNRNSQQKKVFEYLIIGVFNNDSNQDDLKICKFKESISSIDATNKSPLYNNMLYWSQKPYNITDCILDIFSKEGDTILDPFMGSGVTLLESLNKKYKLKSIGIDINDAPIFLCKNSLNIISDKEINKINNLKNDVAKLYSEYYTKCEFCSNNEAIIKKIVYDTEPEFNIKDIIYSCSCNKKNLHKKADVMDISNFKMNRKIENIKNIKLLENSRIAVKANERISDKFSNRSLFILDEIKKLINEIDDEKLLNICKYIYISIIHKRKILDVKMSSQWPLWIPKNNCIERNVPMLFINSIDSYLSSTAFIENNYYANSFVNDVSLLDNTKSFIIKKGTQFVDKTMIKDESIDLVITDPPYLGQVPYSEYMQLYQAFLDNNIDYDSEIVMTNAKGRKKDYHEYLKLMNEAFNNVSRMLKNNSYMFLYFHDSNLNVWNDLIKMFTENKLIFQTSIHISKSKKTLKKILDPKKTMNGETLLIFKKEKNYEKKESNKKENYIDSIKIICNNLLTDKESISTSELYDNGVLEYIIKNDLLEEVASKFKDLTEIFTMILVWDPDTGMWKSKNE